MTKISVIVPVYNVEDYLNKCINALKNQTLTDLEFIFINDGSTDNSLKILENFAAEDSRAKIINQENQGVGAARTVGLKIATGQYAGFVDPDDWVDLDFFEKLYNATDNGNIDIVKGNADIIKFNGKIEHTPEQENIKQEIEKDSFPFTSFGGAWFSAIYKKELIDKYSVNFPNTQYLEDVAFLSKILYVAGSFKLVNDSFYHYFKRKSSLTNKKFTIKTYEHFFNSYKDIMDFLNKTDSSKEKYLKFCNNKVIGSLQWALLCVIQGIGFDNFDYFANTAFDILYSCKYLDDIEKLRSDEFTQILKNKNIEKLKKYLFTRKPKLTKLQRIFSVKNWGGHKIYTILGLEIKIPLKHYRKSMKQWE